MPRYFLSILVYFWIPVIVMGVVLYPRQDRLTKKSFWLTIALLYPLTTISEYVYLHYDIWTFSEKFDPLLGPRIFGAPIEEFWFYYGAVPFAMLVYMLFDRIFGPRPAPAGPTAPARRQSRTAVPAAKEETLVAL